MAERKVEEYKQEHKDREHELTYYAGWSLGYWEGRLRALEDTADDGKKEPE